LAFFPADPKTRSWKRDDGSRTEGLTSAKAGEHPPEPKVGVLMLDPTQTRRTGESDASGHRLVLPNVAGSHNRHINPEIAAGLGIKVSDSYPVGITPPLQTHTPLENARSRLYSQMGATIRRHEVAQRADAMNDTPAAISKIIVERHCAMTPAERWSAASTLFEAARKIVESSLPSGLEKRFHDECRRLRAPNVTLAGRARSRL
jgi:hypothetical protein